MFQEPPQYIGKNQGPFTEDKFHIDDLLILSPSKIDPENLKILNKKGVMLAYVVENKAKKVSRNF